MYVVYSKYSCEGIMHEEEIDSELEHASLSERHKKEGTEVESTHNVISTVYALFAHVEDCFS